MVKNLYIYKWGVPEFSPTFQTIPPQLLMYLSTYYGDYSLSHLINKSSPFQWNEKLLHLYDIMYPCALMGAEFIKKEFLHPLKINHSQYFKGIISTEVFGDEKFIGYYNGWLVYSNFEREPKMHRKDEESIMVITVYDFENWSIELWAFNTLRWRIMKFWIVPANFSCQFPSMNQGQLMVNGKKRNLEVSFSNSVYFFMRVSLNISSPITDWLFKRRSK